MSSPQSSNTVFAAFSLDSAELSKSAINTVRTTLGVSGAVALIVGILITFWPKNSLLVITVILGIYFIIAGLAYAGLGIFSKGISGGARALDIILGVRVRDRRHHRPRQRAGHRGGARRVLRHPHRHPVDRRGDRGARAVE